MNIWIILDYWCVKLKDCLYFHPCCKLCNPQDKSSIPVDYSTDSEKDEEYLWEEYPLDETLEHTGTEMKIKPFMPSRTIKHGPI